MKKGKKVREMLMLAMLMQYPKYDGLVASSIITMNKYEIEAYLKIYNSIAGYQLVDKKITVKGAIKDFFRAQTLISPFDNNTERRKKLRKIEVRMRKMVFDLNMMTAIENIGMTLGMEPSTPLALSEAKFLNPDVTSPIVFGARSGKSGLNYDIVRSQYRVPWSAPMSFYDPRIYNNNVDNTTITIGAPKGSIEQYIENGGCASNIIVLNINIVSSNNRVQSNVYDKIHTMLVLGVDNDIIETLINGTYDPCDVTDYIAEKLNDSVKTECASNIFKTMSVGDKIYVTQVIVEDRNKLKYIDDIQFSLIITSVKYKVPEFYVHKYISMEEMKETEEKETEENSENQSKEDQAKEDGSNPGNISICKSCTGPIEISIEYMIIDPPKAYDLAKPPMEQMTEVKPLSNCMRASMTVSGLVYTKVFLDGGSNDDIAMTLIDSLCKMLEYLKMEHDSILYVTNISNKLFRRTITLNKFFWISIKPETEVDLILLPD